MIVFTVFVGLCTVRHAFKEVVSYSVMCVYVLVYACVCVCVSVCVRVYVCVCVCVQSSK